MTSRPKKTVLTERLAVLNRAISRFKGGWENAWALIKQLWYIPFIWALAWFSYWIFNDLIVYNLPLTQGNPVNYFGVAISIAALIVAGYTYEKSHKKLRSFRNAHKREKNLIPSISQKPPVTKIQNEENEQLIQKRKDQSLIEITSIQESQEMPQKSSPTSINFLTLHNRTQKVNQGLESEVKTSDCLTCTNLVDCKHRQTRNNQLETPCPFAKSMKETRG